MENNKLCLGTVQLGMNYGINNPDGKPSKEKSLEILDFAFNNGIRIFDTAEAYGDAEEILGEFIKMKKIDDIQIISKLKPNIFKGNEDYDTIEKTLHREILNSVHKLNIDKFYGYLLHTPEYVYNDYIIKALKYFKKIGLIENFGVSVYEEKEALYSANLPVDFIQIPYNILDQRLDKTDFFKICRENGIKVFARSPFLQGLLVMDKEKIPEHLSYAKGHIKEFEKILNGFPKIEASLLFSYNHPDIDYIVFGVNNKWQLNEDINIININPRFKEIYDKLKNKFGDLHIAISSLWKK